MNQKELLYKVLRGNESAIQFIELLGGISQVWDDLIDGDDADGPAVNGAFIDALCMLPRNQFYAQNFSELQPLIDSAILDWLTSNQLEDEGERTELSWALRDSLAAVIVGAAKIVGGMAWANEISKTVRLFVHDESIEGYRDGITSRRR